MLLPYHCQHSKSSLALSLLFNPSSELLQHHLLHTSSVLVSQKQAMVELGSNKNMGQREKLQARNPLFPYKQKSGALHSPFSQPPGRDPCSAPWA